jgi:predicted Rossmann-fold nucleotide-binding protein
MDELCEALTWAQLGIHHKPCGLWNVAGYYDRLLTFLEHAVAEGFLKAKDRARLLVEQNLTELLAAMARYVPLVEAIPAKLRD